MHYAINKRIQQVCPIQRSIKLVLVDRLITTVYFLLIYCVVLLFMCVDEESTALDLDRNHLLLYFNLKSEVEFFVEIRHENKSGNYLFITLK